jgi:dethiobiotin synthetase
MQSFFITGTDTGVGKTHVSCALIRELVAMDLRVAGMKPLATGAHYQHGELRNEDAMQLMAAANVDVPYEWVNPYCFEPAIAPHIAAQQAGVNISLDVIHQAYRHLADRADVVVVEGVGGWLVPIGDTQTMADVATSLDLSVLLVVGLRLGCLNHALLSAQGIERDTQHFVAWVANMLAPSMPVLQENLETLKSRMPVPLIAVMPFTSSLQKNTHATFDMQALLTTRT